MSWQEIGETELFGKEMSLTALPDDSLFLTVASRVPGSPSLTFAEEPTRMLYHRSTDRGRSWEAGWVDGPEKPRTVIVEPDGSLLMIRAAASAYLAYIYEKVCRPYDPSPDLELHRSSDGGRTWSATIGGVDWDVTTFGEVSAARLGDGRLLAALRTNPPGSEGEGLQRTYLTESSDDGATWCEPWPMTELAEVQVHLLTLGDGRLLGTYTNYHLPFGVCAVVSDDDGRTWSVDAPIQLALSADCYTGWPVTVEMDDDELLSCYMITAYLNEPPEPKGVERSVCEVVRWRLPH